MKFEKAPFEELELEVVVFPVEDIITASPTDDDDKFIEDEWGPWV